MAAGVVDTTIIIHLFRKDPKARAWIASFAQPLAITPISWMEVIYGAGSKAKQAKCKAILSQFDMEYPTLSAMDWAMQQLENHRLSHGTTINDCLIASICHQLQLPLYTHNIKDMQVLLSPSLVILPY